MSEDPLALMIPPAQSDAEYDSIYAAVAETARGRWFLTEYARRNRPSDTESSLAAIARIEATLRVEAAAQSIDRFRFDVLDMAQAIVRTKAEIAAIKPDAGSEGKVEDAGMAAKAVALLSDLESRVNAVIDAWGAPPLPAADEQISEVASEPAPDAAAMEDLPAASAEERQDATLEDISRFMMALEPLVASAHAETFAPVEASAEYAAAAQVEEKAAHEPLAEALTEDAQPTIPVETPAAEAQQPVEDTVLPPDTPQAVAAEDAISEVRPVLEIPADHPPPAVEAIAAMTEAQPAPPEEPQTVEVESSSAEVPFALDVEPPAIAGSPVAEVEVATVDEAPTPVDALLPPEPAREEERTPPSIFGRIQAVLHLLPKPSAQVAEAPEIPAVEQEPAPVAEKPVEFLPAAEFESFSAPVEQTQSAPPTDVRPEASVSISEPVQPAPEPVLEAAEPMELELAPEVEKVIAASAPSAPSAPHSSPQPQAAEEPLAAMTEMVPPVFAALELDSDDFLFGPEPKVGSSTPAPEEKLKTVHPADEWEPADFLLGPAPDMPQPPAPIAAPAPSVAKSFFEDLLADALALPAGSEPVPQAPELMPAAQIADIAAGVAGPMMPEPIVAAQTILPASSPSVLPKQPVKSPARTPNDPLAQLRALSDEEKIALFS